MSNSLSRIHWFSFCGVKVTNLDFNLNTPKLVSVDRPASPKMDYDTVSAPKRHGSRYIKNKYDDLAIKVVVGFHGTAEQRQTAITNLLSQWIGKEGKLIFADRSNCFYNARFFSSCTAKDSGTFTEVTITFIASYCMYELYNANDLREILVSDMTMKADSIDALVNTATWDNITSYTAKQIANTGNFEAQPIIHISGTATLLTFEANGKEFSLSNITEDVFVDTENMIVYKMNGNDKVSVLPQFQGEFPTIPVGTSTAYIGGTSLNVSITVEFRNTFIV